MRTSEFDVKVNLTLGLLYHSSLTVALKVFSTRGMGQTDRQTDRDTLLVAVA